MMKELVLKLTNSYQNFFEKNLLKGNKIFF